MPLSTKIEPPVRCFTCNTVIGGLALKFKDMVDAGCTDMIALNRLRLTSTCCRTVVLSWVDVGAKQLAWPLLE